MAITPPRCLCGHGESCGVCDGTTYALQKRVEELEAQRQEIVELAKSFDSNPDLWLVARRLAEIVGISLEV